MTAGPAANTGPERTLPTGPASTAKTVSVSDFSKAGGTWEIDWARANHDAQLVLDSIDFSKHDIVIWVPGTSNHGVHPSFEAAVRDSYRGEGASLSALEYEASWKMRRSLPTGIATLKLVLEGIAKKLAERGDAANHRVLLGGESQGAWIIGEALADPKLSKIVNRAILVGHPWLAQHQYTEGQDPRVRVINHHGDQVAAPVNGDPTVALDAMLAIRNLEIAKLGTVLKALASNPAQGWMLLKSISYAVPFVKSILRNPHNYSTDMTRAVEYLREGSLAFSGELTAALADARGVSKRAAAAHATVELEAEADKRAAALTSQAAIAAYVSYAAA